MDYSTYSTDSVKFISVIVDTLRCALTLLWCAFIIIPTHGTAFSSGVLTNLGRFGGDVEYIHIAMAISLRIFSPRTAIIFRSLLYWRRRTRLERLAPFLGIEPIEKVIFAVESKSLSCGRECDDFDVGKLGDDPQCGRFPFLSTRFPANFS